MYTGMRPGWGTRAHRSNGVAKGVSAMTDMALDATGEAPEQSRIPAVAEALGYVAARSR